jgi:hypothetical protein
MRESRRTGPALPAPGSYCGAWLLFVGTLLFLHSSIGAIGDAVTRPSPAEEHPRSP